MRHAGSVITFLGSAVSRGKGPVFGILGIEGRRKLQKRRQEHSFFGGKFLPSTSLEV